jgi:hypothetical protein
MNNNIYEPRKAKMTYNLMLALINGTTLPQATLILSMIDEQFGIWHPP